MFPVSPVIVAWGVVMMLVAGFTVGIITGFVLAWLFKQSYRGLWKAGFVGMLAYVTVFVGILFIPAVTRSQNIFANPAVDGLLAAIIAPALRAWLRTPDKVV